MSVFFPVVSSTGAVSDQQSEQRPRDKRSCREAMASHGNSLSRRKDGHARFLERRLCSHMGQVEEGGQGQGHQFRGFFHQPGENKQGVKIGGQVQGVSEIK